VNKTTAMQIFSDLVDVVDSQIVSRRNENGDLNYDVMLTPQSPMTVDDLVRAEKSLSKHDANIELPGMRVISKEERDQRKTEENRRKEMEAQIAEAQKQAEESVREIKRHEAKMARERGVDAESGGGAEKEGGRAADADHPEPLPGPQPFNEETRG
jgi:hypothetical protein